MQKRTLKKRRKTDESVQAMSALHCDKHCGIQATCGCGSMPGEYDRSFRASKSYNYSGQYKIYVHLP